MMIFAFQFLSSKLYSYFKLYVEQNTHTKNYVIENTFSIFAQLHLNGMPFLYLNP